MKNSLVSTIALMMVCVSGGYGADEKECQRLHGVGFTQVKIKDEFWAPRIETNRVNTVWHDIRKCEETGRISNFAKAAGLEEGKFQGICYDDSDVYKVLEGAAYTLSVHPDAELEKKVDEIIDKIAAAQQDDGYLFCYYILTGLDKRWTNLAGMHELYCAGHMFEAAVAYYQATGKRKFLEVALKVADHIGSIFGPGKRSDVPGHEEIEMGLVKLYRVTGEKKYLDLAGFFLEERGQESRRKIYGQYCQDHKPVREQDEIVGHSVRAMYLYAGVTDVAALTGDEGFIRALGKLWDSMVGGKMYITGGVGASREGEAFGGDYDLPNAEAYAETCAAIGLAFWSYRLNLLHGDASYFDVCERAMYNGLLSGVSLDGKTFFYVNPLEADGKTKFNNGANQRKGWFGTSCCPSNIVRFIPSIGGYMYAVDDKGVYVNLYAAGTGKIKWADKSVMIKQETRYPWEGKVKLTIEPEKEGEFAVNLRIPGWVRGEPVPSDLYRFADGLSVDETKAKIKINGKEQAKWDLQKGYAKLSRKWQKGDVIELDMPMPVRRVAAHEKVEADRGKVALQRGPIVYCLEEVDNGPELWEIKLPKESKLTTEYHPELLGGVVVVKGKGIAQKGKASEVDFAAVPYYSWNNRGADQMIVWIPSI